jgi:hypothetical protein
VIESALVLACILWLFYSVLCTIDELKKYQIKKLEHEFGGEIVDHWRLKGGGHYYLVRKGNVTTSRVVE